MGKKNRSIIKTKRQKIIKENKKKKEEIKNISSSLFKEPLYAFPN